MRLSTPVVQAADNDHYLETNLYGEYDKFGVPFADFRNQFSGDQLSTNTIIYGHHIRGSRLFGELTQYKNQSFYEQHPVIRFETPTRKMDWQIIGAFIEELKPDGSHFHYNEFVEAGKDGSVAAYVDQVKARSLINTANSATEDDFLLTLSTCTYEYDEARFVVVAKLIK